MFNDLRSNVLDAYPTHVDRTYAVAAVLLAVWAVVLGPLAGFGGDDVSNWFAFFSLAGVAMLVGLWIERRQRILGLILVVLPGVVVSVATFWLLIPIVVGLILVVTCIMRVRAGQRPN
jgi:hypothetical protein